MTSWKIITQEVRLLSRKLVEEGGGVGKYAHAAKGSRGSNESSCQLANTV